VFSVASRSSPYDEEITVMNADGTGERALTKNFTDDRSPAWSPDGTKIAYVSFINAIPQIFLMNADGTHRKQLTAIDPWWVSDPAWSPDGARLIFAAQVGPRYELRVMNADGTGQTTLMSSASPVSTPSWSPAGTKIAFTRGRDSRAEIVLMEADGSGEMNVTTNTAEDSSPAWSPDGTKLAFVTDRRRGPGYSEIWVMSSDGNDQKALVNHPQGGQPAWSPDGTKIAYATLPRVGGADSEIVVMNADGTGRRDVTQRHDADEYEPDWHTGSLPVMCVAPRVVGQTLGSARTRIRHAACSVGRVRYVRSRVRRGRVVWQSLRPGTRRPRGALISLHVSRGP